MSKDATHETESRGSLRQPGLSRPMSARSDAIRLLLLDMIAGEPRADFNSIAGLTPPEWRRLTNMARQHRLEPLLHRNFELAGNWPVPEEIRRGWNGACRRSAFRALTHQRVTGQIAAFFDAARLPYAALKGAWLASHAYPHPALRPLRDIDILVPFDRAKEAFDLLRRQGFVPRNRSEPSVEHALEHGKHLPGLTAPADKISVEIHHRLLTPGPAWRQQALATEDILRTRIKEPSQAGDIAYPAPTETLLHLMVHSVYEHGLCNGPLVLNDIAVLLDKKEVDWDRLWTLAERGGWSEGCRLILGLVAHYHRLRAPPGPMAAPVPEAVMRMAALMMLQDHAQRGRVALMASLGATPGVFARLRLAARRFRPERHALAGFARGPEHGRHPWLHYPAWLMSRIQQTAVVLLAEEQRADLRRARALGMWLDTEL